MNHPSTAVSTLHNLLDAEAKNCINAEMQLGNILPGWINRASNLALKGVLQKYLVYIHEHIMQLEQFIANENLGLLSLKSRVMTAFVEDTTEKLSSCTDSEVRDACLLASIQQINHYKISVYGTSAAFAKLLNMEKEAIVFHLAEINEKQIDEQLSKLAATEVNILALSPIVLPR